MKCPKCGYLGFETGDRCRNCGYDFSLSVGGTAAELALNPAGSPESALADLDLPPAGRTSERPSQPLDLDRLFGSAAPTPSSLALPDPLKHSSPAHDATAERESGRRLTPAAPIESAQNPSPLPFDEEPVLRSLRPARPPLGVRRTTPDAPRGLRPTRLDPAGEPPIEAPPDDAEPIDPGPELSPPGVLSMEPAPLPIRVAGLLIDALLIGGVSIGVVVLTARITGLALTWTDLRIVPVVPFMAFLGLLSIGYVASFTVAGGQTIGKMLVGTRVIGDDGRAVDIAGAVLRALGCALVPLTLGLSYAPVILSTERRAVHDRLAGTRVIRA